MENLISTFILKEKIVMFMAEDQNMVGLTVFVIGMLLIIWVAFFMPVRTRNIEDLFPPELRPENYFKTKKTISPEEREPTPPPPKK